MGMEAYSSILRKLRGTDCSDVGTRCRKLSKERSVCAVGDEASIRTQALLKGSIRNAMITRGNHKCHTSETDLVDERFSGHANERTVTASALHLPNLIAYSLKSTCIVIEESVNSCVI